MPAKETLGQFEQLVLTAVNELGDDAYGLQVFKKVCELADRRVNLGSVYVTLDRLEKKGYVTSALEEGGPERANNPRRHYVMQEAGRTALEQSVLTAMRVTQSVLNSSWGFGKWKLKKEKS